MATNFRHLQDGINIVPKSVSTISTAGDIDYSINTGKFNFYEASGPSAVVTESGTATLTNKTIDANSNTISNIANGNIATNASIAFSKLAPLPSTQILVGNGSNVATAVAVTGDVTISNSGVTTVGFVGTSSASLIHTAELLANAATDANTASASAIVKRDISGNFSASTITANLNGNATTATSATTAGSSTTAGNVTGIVQPDHGGTGIANNSASTITINGSFPLGLTLTASTALILPTSGTIATIAGVQTLTNKTINDANNTLSVTSTSVKSGVANAGDVLTADGAGNTVFAPATSGSTFDYSTKTANLALAASVGSNNLTVSLKNKAGSNPSGGDPVLIGFRNSTLTTGTYNIRTISSSMSIIAPSGASFGLVDNSSFNQEFIHVYAIDNSGTVELALAGNKIFNEALLYSTTAIGAGSTSGQVLYSTAARSNVPVRYIGRIGIIEASAGIYSSSPISISTTVDSTVSPRSGVHVYGPGVGAGGYGTTNTKIRRFTTILRNEGNGISYGQSSTLGDTFEIHEDGLYSIMYQDRNDSTTANLGISINSSQLTTNIQSISNVNILSIVNTGSGLAGLSTATYYLRVGDIIRAHSDGSPNTTDTFGRFIITKVSD